jgi:hypothetical protein
MTGHFKDRRVVAAPPGYWLLMTHADGASLTVSEGLVIMWQVMEDGTPLLHVTFGNGPGDIIDAALELPDGRCIDDDGTVYRNRLLWLSEVGGLCRRDR